MKEFWEFWRGLVAISSWNLSVLDFSVHKALTLIHCKLNLTAYIMHILIQKQTIISKIFNINVTASMWLTVSETSKRIPQCHSCQLNGLNGWMRVKTEYQEEMEIHICTFKWDAEIRWALCLYLHFAAKSFALHSVASVVRKYEVNALEHQK